MRKIHFILMLGVAVAVAASGTSTISWKSTSVHLGQITVGVKQAVTFEFVNTSEKPVRIVSAKGSCGCTNVTFSPGDILPGETANITADFFSKRPGIFRKNISVRFAGEEQPTYLYFEGELLK